MLQSTRQILTDMISALRTDGDDARALRRARALRDEARGLRDARKRELDGALRAAMGQVGALEGAVREEEARAVQIAADEQKLRTDKAALATNATALAARIEGERRASEMVDANIATVTGHTAKAQRNGEIDLTVARYGVRRANHPYRRHSRRLMRGSDSLYRCVAASLCVGPLRCAARA
jgi:hypothetical protein